VASVPTTTLMVKFLIYRAATPQKTVNVARTLRYFCAEAVPLASPYSAKSRPARHRPRNGRLRLWRALASRDKKAPPVEADGVAVSGLGRTIVRTAPAVAAGVARSRMSAA
jgi:hypothetical protein